VDEAFLGRMERCSGGLVVTLSQSDQRSGGAARVGGEPTDGMGLLQGWQEHRRRLTIPRSQRRDKHSQLAAASLGKGAAA
jgi:hypothetical protein